MTHLIITSNNVYNCFEFEQVKEDNIYMSPELFKYYFINRNKKVSLLDEKKSSWMTGNIIPVDGGYLS